MKEVLQFCLNYWREILAVCSVIITVVLYLVKRRPLVNLIDTIKEDALELLPVLINKVEKDGSGQQKKATVLEAVIQYIEKKYKTAVSPYIVAWLSDMIESILSTPTKKGE